MADFRVVSEFSPTGDQPKAIDQLADGVQKNYREQSYRDEQSHNVIVAGCAFSANCSSTYFS